MNDGPNDEELDPLFTDPSVGSASRSSNGLLPPAEGVGEVSILALFNSVLRSWRLFLVLPPLVGALALAAAVIWPSHTARSQFAPATVDAGSAGQFSGLAAQFGFSLGGLSGGEPIDFYADLVRSRDLLGELAMSTYRFSEDPDGPMRQGDLIALYEINGETPEDTLRTAVDRLADDVAVRVSPKSGIVSVETTAPWSELAEGINRRVLDLVAEYNLERRQTQAKSERRFIEERLAVARTELDSAEVAVAGFLAGNRGYQHSPMLSLELDRLQRRARQAEQIHVSLAEGFERARMDEVRNTPVFTVIESPEGSARPRGSKLVSLVIGGILGLALAFLIALVRSGAAAFVRRQAVEDPVEFAETVRLTGAVLPGLRARQHTANT